MYLKKWGVAALAVIAGLSWAGRAAAVNSDGYDIPYVGASYLYEHPDSARNSGHGQGFQLQFGWPLLDDSYPRLTPEVTLHSLERKRDIDGNKDYQTGLQFDLVYDFGRIGGAYAVKPFVLGGLGVVQNDVRGDKHEHLGLDAGAGVLLPLTPLLDLKGLAVRLEARALLQFDDRSTSDSTVIDYRVSAGLQLPLFFLFTPSQPAVAPAADCPLAVVDPVTGRHDCSVDSDHDGVTDAADQCPGTAVGVHVDAVGCNRTPGLQGVQFAENSAQLDAQAQQRLDEVAAALKAQPGISVQIIGNADSQGDKSYNLMLSNERAEAVRQYLISKGIDGQRLVSSGRGEFYPVASNESADGRAENRRVEFKLIVQ
jgi:outer membrane protein OmpA-like peptidoglycan-associated protein